MAAPAFFRPLLATEHGAFDAGAEGLAFAWARQEGQPLMAVMPLVRNAEFEVAAPRQAERADERAAQLRLQLQTAATDAGVALDLRLRPGAELYLEILAEVRERAADVLIIRRRGQRGFLANLLVGEMVSKVLAHATSPVLVVPHEAQMWRRQVLAAVDPEADEAISSALVERAALLAARHALPLTLLSVVRGAADEAAVQPLLARLGAQAQAVGATAKTLVRTGRAHEQILAQAAESGADLLVVGRHNGGALGRAWVGGTAQKVTGLSPCAVWMHVPASASPA